MFRSDTCKSIEMTRVFQKAEIQRVIFSMLKQNILMLSKNLPLIIFLKNITFVEFDLNYNKC